MLFVAFNHFATPQICACFSGVCSNKMASNAGAGDDDMTGPAKAAQQQGLQIDDEDLNQLKLDFDDVVKRNNLADDATSSRIADYLMNHEGPVNTEKFANTFGLTMKDANTMLMWIHIGTRFKSEVIDTSADRARNAHM